MTFCRRSFCTFCRLHRIRLAENLPKRRTAHRRKIKLNGMEWRCIVSHCVVCFVKCWKWLTGHATSLRWRWRRRWWESLSLRKYWRIVELDAIDSPNWIFAQILHFFFFIFRLFVDRPAKPFTIRRHVDSHTHKHTKWRMEMLRRATDFFFPFIQSHDARIFPRNGSHFVESIYQLIPTCSQFFVVAFFRLFGPIAFCAPTAGLSCSVPPLRFYFFSSEK